MTAPVLDSLRRTIPFDYTFRFRLTGEVGKVHHEVVRVSVESPFVAVAIGYGVIPTRDPLRFGPEKLEDIDADDAELTRVQAAVAAVVPNPPTTRSELLALPTALLPTGFVALRPAVAAAAARPAPVMAGVRTLQLDGVQIATISARLQRPPGPVPAGAVSWPPPTSQIPTSWISNALRRVIREQGPDAIGLPRRVANRPADVIDVLARGIRFNPEILESVRARGANAPLRVDELPTLFEEIPADATRIQFLYALHDQGTGRAFQTEPILSTAGLGIEDGDRPFRQFAVPIVFDPRATIRMDIIERCEAAGELHVALHGYRVLGGPGSPTDPRRPR